MAALPASGSTAVEQLENNTVTLTAVNQMI
jgi:hypothetical protein